MVQESDVVKNVEKLLTGRDIGFWWLDGDACPDHARTEDSKSKR
jgi:hypothetical protein